MLHGMKVLFTSTEISICIETVVSKATNAANVVSDILYWFSPSTDLETDEENWFVEGTDSKIQDPRYWITMGGVGRKIQAREDIEIGTRSSLSFEENFFCDKFKYKQVC